MLRAQIGTGSSSTVQSTTKMSSCSSKCLFQCLLLLTTALAVHAQVRGEMQAAASSRYTNACWVWCLPRVHHNGGYDLLFELVLSRLRVCCRAV